MKASERTKLRLINDRFFIVKEYLKGREIKFLAKKYRISLMQMTLLLWNSGIVRTRLVGKKIIMLKIWSKSHIRCVKCKTTSIRHAAYGLCEICKRKYDRQHFPELMRKRSLDLYWNNKKRARISNKKYLKNNRTNIRIRMRKWRNKNRDSIRERNRVYMQNKRIVRNPESRKYRRNWLLTNDMVNRVRQRDNDRCRYCGKKCSTKSKPVHPLHLTIHHITPISVCLKLKRNPNTFDNLVVACLRDNLRIHTMVIKPNSVNYTYHRNHSFDPINYSSLKMVLP